MLRDHRPLIATFADKAAVRRYIADAVGERYLPVAYAVSEDPESLLRLELPEAYVVKPTHGSGAAVVVSASAPEDARLPHIDGSWTYAHVRPEHADRLQLTALARAWLSQLYGQGPNREWAYGQVPPRVIVEEFLAGPAGEIPGDFKLFVFHGRCRYINVDDGRFGARTQDFHEPDWSHIPMSGGPRWAEPPHSRPQRLDEMIALAERLGADTDFVRVDLYHLPDRVIVGELTSYPAGGDSPFEPQSFNTEFGRHWTVPRRYR